jgi:hypothetical protein
MDKLASRAARVRAGGLNDDDTVPSPCVSICQMDADQVLCMGCLRTLDELRAWSTLDAAGKRAVWQRIETRLPSNKAPL